MRLDVRIAHERAFTRDRCALCGGAFRPGARIVRMTSLHVFGQVRHAAHHWPVCPIADLLSRSMARAA